MSGRGVYLFLSIGSSGVWESLHSSATFLHAREGGGRFSSLLYIIYSLFNPWVSMVVFRV